LPGAAVYEPNTKGKADRLTGCHLHIMQMMQVQLALGWGRILGAKGRKVKQEIKKLTHTTGRLDCNSVKIKSRKYFCKGNCSVVGVLTPQPFSAPKTTR
jgi:hypothetical protein